MRSRVVGSLKSSTWGLTLNPPSLTPHVILCLRPGVLVRHDQHQSRSLQRGGDFDLDPAWRERSKVTVEIRPDSLDGCPSSRVFGLRLQDKSASRLFNLKRAAARAHAATVHVAPFP